MKKPDTRVQFTKAAFHQAMLTLLKQMPIGKITIKDLCEEAGLNRGTFYLHYNSPYDLLKEIENQFVEDNMAYFSSYWDSQRNLDRMAGLFACVLSNKEICRVLMGSNGDPQFMRSLKVLVRTGVIDEWQKEFPTHSRVDLDMLFDFVFAGSMELILDWIADDCGVSATEFAERLEKLGHYCLLAAGEFSKRNH